MKNVEQLNGEELKQLILMATEMLKDKFPEHEFEPLKKARKVRRETPTVPIPTYNRFQELQQVEDETVTEAMDEENQPGSSQAVPEPAQSQPGPAYPKEQKQKPKTPRIAPIFLKDKSKWSNTQSLVNRHRIQTNKCKLVSSGIQVDPATEDD